MDLMIAFAQIAVGVLALPAAAACLAGAAIAATDILLGLAETLALAWAAEVFWIDGERR